VEKVAQNLCALRKPAQSKQSPNGRKIAQSGHPGVDTSTELRSRQRAQLTCLVKVAVADTYIRQLLKTVSLYW
jgi:hypothetical protein